MLFFKTRVKGLTNTACCGSCRVVVFTDEALDLTVLQYHCLVEHDYVHPSIFFILLCYVTVTAGSQRGPVFVFFVVFFFIPLLGSWCATTLNLIYNHPNEFWAYSGSPTAMLQLSPFYSKEQQLSSRCLSSYTYVRPSPATYVCNNVISLQKNWCQSMERSLVHLRANIDRQQFKLLYDPINQNWSLWISKSYLFFICTYFQWLIAGN